MKIFLLLLSLVNAITFLTKIDVYPPNPFLRISCSYYDFITFNNEVTISPTNFNLRNQPGSGRYDVKTLYFKVDSTNPFGYTIVIHINSGSAYAILEITPLSTQPKVLYSSKDITYKCETSFL